MSQSERFVDVSGGRRSPVRRLRRYARTLQHADLDWVSEVGRTRLERRTDRKLLAQVRAGRDVCWASEDPDPLVTVRIATYNRGPVVLERAVASALRQTYTNIEVLVVGDHCDEESAEVLRAVDDPRFRFVNLPARPVYPLERRKRWQVAGFEPMNVGIALASGEWMAPCDDDDELTDDHVEVLLRHAQAERLEFVWSRTQVDVGGGNWAVIGHPRLRQGHITHGSMLYSSGLRFMRYKGTSHMVNEPFDWNMWRRMQAAGVKMGFLDAITYKYYPSAEMRDAYVEMARRLPGSPAEQGWK